MYIKLLLRLLLGYVRVEIEGYYVERFINICTNKKILIWNIKRQKGVKLYFNIGIKDFKKLSKIAKKTQCKIKILKKKGIPFLLNKYKKRKIFAMFLIILLCIIYTSSKYVWNVEIIIENNLEIKNIEEEIKNIGLTKGILKESIDTEKIINELRLKRDDIAWIGIDIKGTNVKVNIVKAEEQPQIISNSDYCDIIASKPGTITKITAQNGTAVVNIGDTVQKGDILIAGYMEGKYTEPRQVHSLGIVEAKVLYEKSKEIKLKEEVLEQVQEYENKYEINFNNYKIKFYKNISKFETYETIIEEKNLKIFNDFYIPISITKITNKKLDKQIKEYTKEEAINIGDELLSREIEQEIENNANVVKKYIKTQEDSNSIMVTVTYEVIENIGEYSITNK